MKKINTQYHQVFGGDADHKFNLCALIPGNIINAVFKCPGRARYLGNESMEGIQLIEVNQTGADLTNLLKQPEV